MDTDTPDNMPKPLPLSANDLLVIRFALEDALREATMSGTVLAPYVAETLAKVIDIGDHME